MPLYGERQMQACLSLSPSNRILNKSLIKIGQKSHIDDKHKPAHFRVETADGKSGILAVRGKKTNVMLDLFICLSLLLFRFSHSLTEKFQEGFLFRDEGLAFVNRVTDLLELLLEYRYGGNVIESV